MKKESSVENEHRPAQSRKVPLRNGVKNFTNDSCFTTVPTEATCSQVITALKKMPFGCCRALRGDGARSDAEASGGDGTHYVGNAPFNYGPDLHLEPVHLEIGVDLLDATFSTKRAKMTITHTVKCNNVSFRTLVLNGIGTSCLRIRTQNPGAPQ